MSKPLEKPTRTSGDLAPHDRARLEAVYNKLKAAARATQEFRGGCLEPGKNVEPMSARDMALAYSKVSTAEENLWRLREELLGWRRPAWSPPSTQLLDWFCEEDAAYDSFPTAD